QATFNREKTIAAQATGHAHLRQSNGKAALGRVVSGVDQSLSDHVHQQILQSSFELEIQFGRAADLQAMDQGQILAATERTLQVSKDDNDIALLLEGDRGMTIDV